MNFKDFYTQQLFESVYHQYPFPEDMDGSRLFYYVTLNESGEVKRVTRQALRSGRDQFTQGYKEMCDVFDEEVSDIFESISGVVNYEQALQITLEAFWEVYDETSGLTIEHAAANFKRYMRQLENVKGVWNVLKIDADYLETGQTTFYTTIEVDVAHTRQQQIQNDLKDVDTTGLEDLL